MVPLCAPVILGVMGWTSESFWRKATLYDVAMTLMGFGAWHGVAGREKYPDAEFMALMMEKYPDQKEG
jgi:hypothetical protein